MRSKVESLARYQAVHQLSDIIGLLNLIKLVTFDYSSQKNSYVAVIKVEKGFKNFRQGKTMTYKDYYKKFLSLSEAYISCGGTGGNEEGLMSKVLSKHFFDLDSENASQKASATEIV